MNFFPIEERNNEQQLFTCGFQKRIFVQQLLTDAPKTRRGPRCHPPALAAGGTALICANAGALQLARMANF
jgi:hypothetical protein